VEKPPYCICGIEFSENSYFWKIYYFEKIHILWKIHFEKIHILWKYQISIEIGFEGKFD
jgi:hypothetical protein